VLDLITDQKTHGATDDEIEHALGLRHQSASARRNGLMKLGLVVDSGLKRRTHSGRQAVVWVRPLFVQINGHETNK
jgi:hypothetical protein